MIPIEDPMLALLLRFVVNEEKLQHETEEFIQRQIRTLQEYLQQYPADEQDKRTLDWIEHHAAEYRKNWEMRLISKEASRFQCADCPLVKNEDSSHCAIHNQWLELLKKYGKDMINSTDYIKEALELLTQHKENLRICRKNKKAVCIKSGRT